MDEEFSTTELHHMSNTTTRESLEEDLLETARDIFHKEVREFQMQTRERIMRVAIHVCDRANLQAKKLPKEEREDFLYNAQKRFYRFKQAVMQHSYYRVQAMEEELCYTQKKIHRYCRQCKKKYPDSSQKKKT